MCRLQNFDSFPGKNHGDTSEAAHEGVTEPVLQRAFQYWRNVDKDVGDRIEAGVRAKQS